MIKEQKHFKYNAKYNLHPFVNMQHLCKLTSTKKITRITTAVLNGKTLNKKGQIQ